MTRRPRILLDVDGPLTLGFFEAACDVLRDLGVDARPEKIDRWDIGRAFGVTPDTGREMYDRLRAPGVASSFAPRPGAREFVADLQAWADVYAVTAPLGGPHWAHDREIWLEEHVGIRPDRVVSTRDKTVVVGDALVDDKIDTLIGWKDEHPLGHAIFWREPHNQASTYLEVTMQLIGAIVPRRIDALQAIDFAYGNLACSTRHKPVREAFRRMALERGIPEERFEVWAVGKDWGV